MLTKFKCREEEINLLSILTKKANKSIASSYVKRNNFKKDFKKSIPLLLMLLPGSLILIINNYLPMVGILIAFQKVDYRKGLLFGDWVGFNNFKVFLTGAYAFIITRNTVLYNLVFIFLGTAVAIFMAIALNEITKTRLKKIYQSAMFLPYFMSWIVISYIAFAFFGNQYGFINNTILKGLGMKPISFYNETKFWPFIIIFSNIWKYTGYNAVVYLASIAGIDTEYYEAAEMDGASKLKQITSITIPLLKPVIIIMILLALGRIVSADFGLFYVLPLDSGALYPVTNVLDTYVYRAMAQSQDYAMAAAAGLFQSVVGMIMVLTSNHIVKKFNDDSGLF